MQENALISSTHVPSLAHGLLTHSSISEGGKKKTKAKTLDKFTQVYETFHQSQFKTNSSFASLNFDTARHHSGALVFHLQTNYAKEVDRQAEAVSVCNYDFYKTYVYNILKNVLLFKERNHILLT